MPPFTVALVVAFFLAITGAAIVLDRFGAESFFPGSHCGLPWTLGAFLLALTWERERELGGARKEAADLGARHGSEVRRRFESVATELQKNADSLESLSGVFEKPSPGVLMIANPQLLEGAWTANAPRLSELVADYRLRSQDELRNAGRHTAGADGVHVSRHLDQLDQGVWTAPADRGRVATRRLRPRPEAPLPPVLATTVVAASSGPRPPSYWLVHYRERCVIGVCPARYHRVPKLIAVMRHDYVQSFFLPVGAQGD